MPLKNTFTLAFRSAGILVLSLALGSCSMMDSSKKDDPIPSQAQKDQKEKPNTREVHIPLEKSEPAKNTLPEELTEVQTSIEPKQQEVKGARFTMSARGVSIKNVLFALSQEIEQNIVIHPDVDRTGAEKLATVDLKNVTLEEALESLLPPLRLTYEIDERYIRVAREEMQTRTFFLNYVISRRVGKSNLTSSSGAATSSSSGSSSSDSSSSSSGSSSGNSSANSRSTSSVEASEETDLWDEVLTGLKNIVTPSASTSGSNEESSETSTSAESGGGDSSSDLVASLLGGGGSPTVEGASEGGNEESSTSSSQNQEFVENGFLVVNKQAGMITVKDYPEILLQVAEYLEAIEGSVQRQVFIQAKIVEVTLNDDFQLGINWASVSPFTISHDGGLNLASALIAGTSDFSYGLANGKFNVVVDALSKQGQVSVLSSPKIATLNNQRAVIKVGTEDIFFRPEITAATTTSAATTEFIPETITIGIVLDVVPQINPNGQIMMSINTSITEKSGERTSPDGVNVVPILDVRESNNVVLAQHGQTIVIDGLMKTKKEVNDNSVPFLGAIPYVGNLFHWDQENEAKTELVIMLTPEIMAGQAINDKYLSERSNLRNFGYDETTDRIVNPSFKR
jgi:MSHA biogenesis protein MshL